MNATYEAVRPCHECEGTGFLQYSYDPRDSAPCFECDGLGSAVYYDLSFGDLTDEECLLLPEYVLNAHMFTKINGIVEELSTVGSACR